MTTVPPQPPCVEHETTILAQRARIEELEAGIRAMRAGLGVLLEDGSPDDMAARARAGSEAVVRPG